MSTNVSIRMATEEDAEEILRIYSPYVTDTAITFEYDIPSVTEFSRRIKDTLKMYPYIVALEEKRIVGYAYASAFKERAAYDWAVETTVYLKQDCRGKGLGKKLYLALEDILKRQNILNLNACIAYTSVDDVRLNNTSTAFHQHLGYSKVAHFTKCGYKFGTWYDVIWMEKLLGEHPPAPDPVIPIAEIKYKT
jgi:L-amino acid N-acyltransferase YncA